MRIERSGRGPREYLGLHGWNGGRQTFRPLTGALPDDVTFRSADLPGCGDSAPPSRWDLDCIVDEIVRELDAPTTLVGNCSGAILALLAAARAPSRVARIVLIDAFAYWPWYFRLFVSESIGRYAYYSTFANPVGRWLANAFLRGKRSADTDLTRGFETANHEATRRYLLMLRHAGSPAAFAGLSMPIDILYGARSFAAVRHSARIWARVWPHARTFELENAGHLPILEAAPRIEAILFGGNSCPTAQPAHSLNSAR